MNFVGRLAVVIPTMDRADFMLRSIRWFEKIGVPLFIGDSSYNPQYTTMFPFGDYTHYLHTPGANEIMASLLAARMMQLQTTIQKTPLIAWCGDDDFLLPGALEEACQVLEASKRATSAAGLATIFATVKSYRWGPIESSVGAYPDLLFRVFRRDVILTGWELAAPLEKGETHAERAGHRGAMLHDFLGVADHQRYTSHRLFLMRQVHPDRVTAGNERESFRTWMGHLFPRLQYLNQRLRARCFHQWRGQCRDCQLSLPNLRNPSSPHFADFAEVENFLRESKP